MPTQGFVDPHPFDHGNDSAQAQPKAISEPKTTRKAIDLCIPYLLLFLASAVYRLIVNTGVSVISRVMGIVLATIAVDSVFGGLDALGVIDLASQAR